jgi:hypothetical protein
MKKLGTRRGTPRILVPFLEGLVVAAILLVLAHTFFEDYAVLAGWTVAARRFLVLAGLGFDVFFTIEFLVRLYLALAARQGTAYFFRQRGWIDFLASVPLLLLNSLPNTLALLAGAGLLAGLGSFLNVLKVIKAVRIARVLRLMRVIKLFRTIRYIRSPMAQDHVATITTISVSILVFWMLVASALGSLGVFTGLEASFREGQEARARYVAGPGPAGTTLAQRAAIAASLDPTILRVRSADGSVSWSRYDAAYYRTHFLPGDYAYFSGGGVEVFLDERPLARAAAREGIVFFVAVVLSLLGFLFLYAPRFAMNISDPIHVMRRGMEEGGYNLQVKIPRAHAEEDVFQLGALYNGVFLPMKDREAGGGDTAQTALDIELLKDIAGKR